MKVLKKIYFAFLLLGLAASTATLQAQHIVDEYVDPVIENDSLQIFTPVVDLEELHPDSAAIDSIVIRSVYVIFDYYDEESDSLYLVDRETLWHRADSLLQLPEYSRDSMVFKTNPLLLPLVFQGRHLEGVRTEYNFADHLYGPKVEIDKRIVPPTAPLHVVIDELRREARTYIANHKMELYVTSFDRLPKLSSFMLSGKTIEGAEVETLSIYDDKIKLERTKIDVEDIRKVYWHKNANAILQFSQNHVSSNWHQGGNSHMSFLSVLQGELNYNNRKNTIWENKFEWRTGFNRVQSEAALRSLNINDDLMRLYSKYGRKAGGNWYYSVNAEATTQLLNNYKSFDSEEFKGRLLTPVRANVGMGMDYKYKKFSMMVAPLSFKYIYLNDTVNVNPNQFGIQKGKNQLKQFGSSLRADLKFKPTRNWTFDSHLKFYTDYKKIEVDLEVVNEFIINRYMTTRLMINPRFDNTIILKEGEKSKIQYKELLSIGFSYRFI